MNKENLTKVSLYSPKTLIWGWSLILTPIFGAILHARNWRVLGNEAQAKKSMKWAYSFMIIYVLLLIIIKLQIDNNYNFIKYELLISLFWLTHIICILTFYIVIGKSQIKYLKEQYKEDYEKKQIYAYIASFMLIVRVIIYIINKFIN